jgi:hypothetical protein
MSPCHHPDVHRSLGGGIWLILPEGELRKFPKNLPNSPKHQVIQEMTAEMTAEATVIPIPTMIPTMTPIPRKTPMRLTQYLILTRMQRHTARHRSVGCSRLSNASRKTLVGIGPQHRRLSFGTPIHSMVRTRRSFEASSSSANSIFGPSRNIFVMIPRRSMS